MWPDAPTSTASQPDPVVSDRDEVDRASKYDSERDAQAIDVPLLPTEPTAAEIRTVANATMRDHLHALAVEVDETLASRGFQSALDAMAMFWRYSFGNQRLIHAACPQATEIASAKVWARLGRTPVPGTRPIQILAPTAHGFPFILVSVFDISQTEGLPVPALDLELTGTRAPVERLERAAVVLGVRITELKAAHSITGASCGGEIQIARGLPAEEHVSVLAHELAHELLHTNDRARKRGPKRTHAEIETEAEATSYVVLRVLGLPSKAPTYIAWRGGNGASVLRSMRRIQRAASTIMRAAVADG